MPNGGNAIRGIFLTLRKFANINMTKQVVYMLISAGFRIFLEVIDLVEILQYEFKQNNKSFH